jgi:hypothetical protein
MKELKEDPERERLKLYQFNSPEGSCEYFDEPDWACTFCNSSYRTHEYKIMPRSWICAECKTDDEKAEDYQQGCYLSRLVDGNLIIVQTFDLIKKPVE